MLFTADLGYYAEANKKIGFEMKIILQNIVPIIKTSLFSYWYLTAFYTAILIFLYFIWRKNPPVFRLHQRSWTKSIITGILSVCIFLIAIRGGLQTRPLKPIMAFQNENMFLGYLALNGVYAGITAVYRNDVYPEIDINRAESVKSVRKMISSEHEHFMKSDFIFQRKFYPKQKEKKYNVLIIVMESWGYRDIIHPSKSASFFNSLAKKGLLFTNHYSVSQRSISMLPAVVTSIPQIYGNVYHTSSYQNNQQRGLAVIFKEKKYKTLFIYSARKGSMSFSDYASLSGFDKIISKNDFDPSDTEEDGVWGVYDEYSFQRLHHEIEKEKTPFFALIATLHPHPPFSIPSHRKNKNQKKEISFYDDMKYTDQCLREFFKLAKKSWYFDNTLFVIVGDHAYTSKKGIEILHTPLLFYVPRLLKQRKSDQLASHIDIMPTILDLLNLKTEHSSMGKSLLKRIKPTDWAIVDFDNLMGWFEGDHLLLADRNSPVGLFRYKKDPYLYVNLLNEKKTRSLAKKMELHWRSFVSSVSYAVKNNKIAF